MQKYYLLVLIGILALSSCKKDKIITGSSFYDQFTWTENPCEESSNGNLSIGYTNGINYRYPVFNPNNQFEFVYYQFEQDSATYAYYNTKLIKYNMLTKEKQVILEGQKFIGPVAWSKNGQIAFIEFFNPGARVYSMNDDGSNFRTQLSSATLHSSYVNLSPDGDSFYLQISEDISWNDKTYYLIQKNFQEDKIDSIELPHQLYMTDISSKNDLLAFQGGGFYDLMNLSEGPESITINQIEQTIMPSYGIGFNKEGTHFYITGQSIDEASNDGIYKVDIFNNHATEIYTSCKKGYPQGLSVSPSSEHLLIEKRGIMEHNHPYEIWLVDIKEQTETLIIGE